MRSQPVVVCVIDSHTRIKMTNPPPVSEFIGTLDPAVPALLASIQSQGLPGWAYLTIEQGRAMVADMRSLAGDPEPEAHIEDILIPGSPEVPARLYVPEGDRPLPIIVYFHGGGLGTWSL